MGFWLFGWNKVIRFKNQGFQICTKVDADDKVFPVLLTNIYFLEPHRNIGCTTTTIPPDLFISTITMIISPVSLMTL